MGELIKNLPLTNRGKQALIISKKLTTVQQLFDFGYENLRATRGLSQKTFDVIVICLKERGYDVSQWEWFQ